MRIPSVFPADIAQLSVSQLAALPAAQQVEISRHLDEAIDWLKQARAKFDHAMRQCYGDFIGAARQQAGQGVGTIHWQDGSVYVSVDYPQCVRWDQSQLATMAKRIALSGEKVDDFLDITYGIGEERFTNWPSSLRTQFASARVVEPGEPIIRLSLVEEA